MSWLRTYAGYGLPRAELFAQLRADQWGWTREFQPSYPEGASCEL